MTRCVLAWFVALCLGGFVAPASAQALRKFPPDALRGALVVQSPPEVLLGGAPARLAPGVRIRGANNLLLMSATLTGQRLLVHYTLNPQGHLKDVWVLTPQEAAKQPWPSTPQQAASWDFDAAAQTWTPK